jgi:hypothetical protein
MSDAIVLPLKRFLLIDPCPAEWKEFDLYLFRDETTAFYVGQSFLAFTRVWEHLINGFKGHSIVGRFVWVNWPKSMNFTIELHSSQVEEFASIGYDLNAAERLLIERYSPCFNAALNHQPSPLPADYLPANAPYRHRKGLPTLIREAERRVRWEETRSLLEPEAGA